MEIVRVSKENENLYSDFVAKHPKALFYYELRYRDLLKKLLNCGDEYYVLMDGDEVKAVLPMLYKEGIYGRIYNSLAYYGANGSILAENELFYDELLNAYNKVITKAAASTYIENPLDIHEKKPDFDYISERVCLFNEFNNVTDENTLMDQFEPVRRRNVRKAIKEDIIVEIDNSILAIEFLYDTHHENMNAIGGKIKSFDFFSTFSKYYKHGQDFNLYVAKYEGKYIGALLVFYFNDIVEYYTPVIVEEYRNKQPLALLIFQCMKDAISKNYLYFNWGGNGVGLNSVYDFKKKWGAMDYRYNYYVKINNQHILNANLKELQEDYDNFFVVPFDILKG